MPGWLRSASSGPRTWMLSSGISTAWIPCLLQNQRESRQRKNGAAPTASVTKDKRHENQNHEFVRRRPGQGFTLLHRRLGLCQEDRFQSGSIPLADRDIA